MTTISNPASAHEYPTESRSMCSMVLVGAAIRMPHWYASPGINPRTASGASSLRCTGMIPYAPCTPACMMNAAIARTAIVPPKAQKGITSSETTSAAIML